MERENWNTRYRPGTLAEFTGNQRTKERVESLLRPDAPPRSLLISGPVGCGKTTLAGIIAKALSGGGGVREINGADFRGISTAREIIYPGASLFFSGGIIIDEAHRLTRDAQSAALKYLEEPSRVTILVTSEPESLLPALVSRCENLTVGPLTDEEMRENLETLLSREGETLSEEMVNEIIGRSNGIPREARKLIDRVFSGVPLDDGRPDLDYRADTFIMTFSELRDMQLPERQILMEPWLRAGDLVLLSAEPGAGKTFFAMEMAAAISEGRDAMDGLWAVPAALPILYIDGEMDLADMQRRGTDLGLGSANFLSKAFLESRYGYGSFNLALPRVRDFITNRAVERGIKLLVLDNIYSLITGVNHNLETAWAPINGWLIGLRSREIAVVIVHHSNKSGGQLGTSSRVFNLDYHLRLEPRSAENGACSFYVAIEKQRRPIEDAMAEKIFTFRDSKWTVEDFNELGDVLYYIYL